MSMKKSVLTFVAAAGMTAAMTVTSMAAGWQWLDRNGDGIAECYYFDQTGNMLVNTTTPDGYQVNTDGAWVQNGVIQTQAQTQTTGDRYTVLAGPNRVVPPSGTLQDGYTFSRDVWNNFKANVTDTRDFTYRVYGEDQHIYFDHYEYNGEKFTLGRDGTGDTSSHGATGKWVVDNTKPDAANGKTNIRFQFDDGTFAGYGFHALPLTTGMEDAYNIETEILMGERNSDGTEKDWKTDSTYGKMDPTYQKFGYGKNCSYFSEDGYMYRNVYVDGIATWKVMFGYDGSWLDRGTL